MMPFSPKIARFPPSSRQGFISLQGVQLIFAVALLFVFIVIFPRFISHEEKFIPLNQEIGSFSGIDAKGERLSFQDLKGKLNLVVFGASWCTACVQNMNEIESLYQEYSNRGFKVIYIALEKSLEDMQNFKSRFSPSYPMLLQNDETVKLFNSPSAIPSYFILNSSGTYLHKSVGHLPKAEIKRLIENIQ